MTCPPVSASAARVTVPVDVNSETTLAGLAVTDLTADAAHAAPTLRMADAVEPLNDPAIVTWVSVATAEVVRTKLPVVLPAVTVIGETPTAATVGVPLVITTEAFEATAADRVTRPLTCHPPGTAVGLRVTERTVMGVTPSWALTTEPLYEAEIFAVSAAGTRLVETVKVALVCPNGIVTLPDVGTVTPSATESLDTVTTAPPTGAGCERVTVAWVPYSPTTVVGLSVMPASAAVWTVNGAEAVNTPDVAVIVAAVFVATGTVPMVTARDPLVRPAGMVTVGGVKVVSPEGVPESVTIRSVAMGLAIVTVPVTLFPPMTELALRLRLRVSGRTVRVSVAAGPAAGVAVMIGVVCAVTTLVVIVSVWLVVPAAMVTGDCGVADGSELVSVTL
jgi:hypothetical protein